MVSFSLFLETLASNPFLAVVIVLVLGTIFVNGATDAAILSLSIPDDQNYKPYIIYKNVVSELLEQTHYSEGKQNDIIITIWAFIHGITSLATMNNVNYDNDWREKVIDFMDVFQLSFLDNTGEKI